MEIGTEKTAEVEAREEAGKLIHVRDETGEPAFVGTGEFEGEGESKKQVMKPVNLRVCGSYSKTYKDAREKQRSQNMKRGGRALREPKVLDRQELEVHAACVKPEDFGPFTISGKRLEHSLKNVIALLESAPWIREQVEEEVYDHQGFLNARSPS